MTEQSTDHKTTTNGRQMMNTSRKGTQKQWKDLSADPLEKGFDAHIAEYVVGRSPVLWLSVSPG